MSTGQLQALGCAQHLTMPLQLFCSTILKAACSPRHGTSLPFITLSLLVHGLLMGQEDPEDST